jgi:hypothetical protein
VAAGPSPAAREDHTWTVDGDGTRAYLFGGRTGEGASDELWVFDLTTSTWDLAAPSDELPDARWGHTATWVPGDGLVIWSGQSETGFFDDLWRYQPSSNAWQQLQSLGDVPPARYGSCASLGPDGRLWISHGFTEDDGRFADTRAYDFTTGEWTDVTPDGEVPVERCLHDCYWSTENQLVLYGGQTTGVPALGDIWAYDPTTDAWQEGPQSSAPARQLYSFATQSAGGVVVGAAIVFGGGSLDGSYLGDTWLISDRNLAMFGQRYMTEPPPRSGATLIAVGFPRYLLFGGRNSDGLLADMWELSGYPF